MKMTSNQIKRMTVTALLFVLSTGAMANESACKPTWTLATGQPNFAAPAIHDGVVYVGAGDGGIHALDVTSGERRWRHETGAAVDATPLVTEDAVYVQARDGLFRAIDRGTGELLWTFETAEPGPVDFWDFTLSGAALAGDSVLFGSGSGMLYALDAESGELRWFFATGGAIRGTPLVVGSHVYFGSFDGWFRALDVASGDLVWQFKTVGSTFFPEGAIQGSASYADGVVYFGSRDYNLYALNAETGTGHWNVRKPSWVIGPPAMDDKRVYVGTSDSLTVYAIDRASGRVEWEQRVDARVFASPQLHDDELLVGGFNGRLNALDPADGAQRWFFSTAGSREHHQLVYNDDGSWQESFRELFASGRGMDGERLILQLGSIAERVVLHGQTIVFASTDGHIYALDATACQQQVD
jgi:eukaryotic-like serine/threonine-protein kinase